MFNLDRWSVKRIARVAAVLGIGSGVPDGFSVSMIRKVFVPNDAAATAANILHSETLFRASMCAELFALAMFVTSQVMLYRLFKPASRQAARLFLVLTIMGATIQALDVFGDFGALTILKGGAGLAALTIPQLQAMAFVILKMHAFAYNVALVFIGFCSLCLAYLATRATFLPRISGYFLAIDGLGYLTSSFGALLAPTFIVHLRPWVPFVTAIMGTGALLIWLIVKGVDVQRWEEQNGGEPW